MSFCQTQLWFMAIWQSYERCSWFFPLGVKFAKSSELNNARFDSYCVQDNAHFGICLENNFSFAFTVVLWYPPNWQVLADVVICFTFVNFL